MGPHRELRRPLGQAPERPADRLHGPDGILVNTISPGTIVTDSFTTRLRPVLEADGLDSSDPVDVMTGVDRTFHHPADLGRAGLPEEVASLTAYLASRRNGYVTGAHINVDGGSDFN